MVTETIELVFRRTGTWYAYKKSKIPFRKGHSLIEIDFDQKRVFTSVFAPYARKEVTADVYAMECDLVLRQAHGEVEFIHSTRMTTDIIVGLIQRAEEDLEAREAREAGLGQAPVKEQAQNIGGGIAKEQAPDVSGARLVDGWESLVHPGKLQIRVTEHYQGTPIKYEVFNSSTGEVVKSIRFQRRGSPHCDGADGVTDTILTAILWDRAASRLEQDIAQNGAKTQPNPAVGISAFQRAEKLGDILVSDIAKTRAQVDKGIPVDQVDVLKS